MMKLTATALFGFVASLVSAQIECLRVGSTATAQWTNAKKEACSWSGVVGSNFGIDPVNLGKRVHP